MDEDEYQETVRDLVAATSHLSNRAAWKAMTEADQKMAPVLRDLPVSNLGFARHDLRMDAWALRQAAS